MIGMDGGYEYGNGDVVAEDSDDESPSSIDIRYKSDLFKAVHSLRDRVGKLEKENKQLSEKVRALDYQLNYPEAKPGNDSVSALRERIQNFTLDPTSDTATAQSSEMSQDMIDLLYQAEQRGMRKMELMQARRSPDYFEHDDNDAAFE